MLALVLDDDDTSTRSTVAENPMYRLLLPVRLLGSGTKPPRRVGEGLNGHGLGRLVLAPHVGHRVGGPDQLSHQPIVLHMYDMSTLTCRLPHKESPIVLSDPTPLPLRIRAVSVCGAGLSRLGFPTA